MSICMYLLYKRTLKFKLIPYLRTMHYHDVAPHFIDLNLIRCSSAVAGPDGPGSIPASVNYPKASTFNSILPGVVKIRSNSSLAQLKATLRGYKRWLTTLWFKSQHVFKTCYLCDRNQTKYVLS